MSSGATALVIVVVVVIIAAVVAFALLAWLTWNGLPGNVPAATGAKRSAILGKVSYG